VGQPTFIPPIPPQPTEPVGALYGSFAVSDRGTATYEIPIQVPPGRAGVEPRLSLKYTSTKSNGLLGVGWSLEGLSSISRCPGTVAQDGRVAPVRLDISDRYCLDGQRLVAINGAYGADGTEYRTEIDTFAKIVSYGGSGTGPASFKVWTKRGEILSYGSTEDSSIYGDVELNVKRAWALARIEDRSQNFVQINYRKLEHRGSYCGLLAYERDARCGTREIAPDSIAYTGHDSTPGDREVRFVWSVDRHDPLVTYAPPGTFLERTRLLDRVETWISDVHVRSYELQYVVSANGASRVQQIRECGFDGASKICKPATIFTYIDEQVDFEPGVDTGLRPFLSDVDVSRGEQHIGTGWGHPTLVLDANGDGREDLLVAHQKGDYRTWYTLLRATGEPPFFQAIQTSLFVDGNQSDDPPIIRAHQSAVTDYNGDGRDDVIDTQHHGQYRVFISTVGGAFQENSTGLAPFGENVPVPAIVYDVDGDGLKDILEEHGEKKRGNCDGPIVYYKRLPQGGFRSTPHFLPKFGSCTTPPMFVDFDADGTLNLLRQGVGWYALVADPSTTGTGTWQGPMLRGLPANAIQDGILKVMDLNGDGLQDVYAMRHRDANSTRVWLNTGRGVTPPFDAFDSRPFDLNVVLLESFRDGHVLDLNADGMSDLMRPYDRGHPDFGKWLAQFGSDRGLVHGVETLDPLVNAACLKLLTYLADVDGDSNKDLLWINPTGNLIVYRGRGARTNLLSRIVDGLGKRIDIDYESQVGTSRTYTPGTSCSWPTRCIHNVRPLVSSHAVAQVTKSAAFALESTRYVRRYDYRYKDAREGLAGRGWLGFGQRTIVEKDGINHILRTTTIDYDNSTASGDEILFPLAGRVKRVQTDTAPADSDLTDARYYRITEADYTWGQGVSGAGRPFPVLNMRTSRSYELQASIDPDPVVVKSRVETFAVDPFGNVTSATSTDYNGTAEFVAAHVTSRTFEPSPQQQADWLVGLQKLDISSDRMNQTGTVTMTRTTEFKHYPNGLLKDVIREPGDPYYQITTTYVRDNSLGNVDQIIQRDEHGDVRDLVVQYDTQKVYPVSVTNALHPPTQMRFGAAHGELLTLADPNGIVSEWGYDAFGRMRLDRQPERTLTVDYESAELDPTTAPFTLATFRVVTNVVGGPRNEQEFDGFGRTVRTRASGYLGSMVERSFFYGDSGLLATASRPHLPDDHSQGVIEYEYDERERLRQVRLPDQSTIRYGHATAQTLRSDRGNWLRDLAASDIVSVQDPRAFVEAAVYDLRGNLLTTIDAKLAPTDYRYEAFNELNQVIDAKGNVTTIRPDRYGRVEFHHDPDMGDQNYTYSAFDEMRTRRSASNALTSLFYDKLGRLVRRENPDSTQAIEWIYDGAGPNEIGRLIETIGAPGPNSPDGQRVRYAYEPRATRNRGLLQTITRTIDGEPFATSFEYDERGQPKVIHYPSAGGALVVENAYDGAGNLTKVCRNACLGASAETLWEVVAHDQGYRIGEERYGGGVTSTIHTFEPLTGLLSTLITRRGTDVLRSLRYEYDANGNVDRRFNELFHSDDKGYVYDELNRLTDTLGRTGANTAFLPELTITYDSIGNITSKSDVGSYTYRTDGHRPHAVEDAGGRSFNYDANGNQTVRQGQGIVGVELLIEYTSYDMPASVTFGANPAASRVELEYDADQTLVLKRTIAPGGSESTTVYVNELYERRPAAVGFEHQHLVYADGRPIAQITRSGVTDTKRFLHDDRLGSVELITNASGTLEQVQQFGAYGKVAIGGQAGGTTGVQRGFTGHEHDTDLGLINMRGRIYDPMIARFLTADPIASGGQGLNRYSYVRNNPTNFVDPSGFEVTSYGSETTDPTTGEKTFVGGSIDTDPVGSGATSYDLPEFSGGGPEYGGVVPSAPYPSGGGQFDPGAQATGDWAPSAENESAGGVPTPTIVTAAKIVGFGLPFVGSIATTQDPNASDEEKGWALVMMGVEAATFGIGRAVVGVVQGGKLATTAARGGGEITTLFHGSDLVSVQSMVEHGISKASARALGGGDVFWATAKKSVAMFYARANPSAGTPAIAAFKIPTASLQALVKSGAVGVDRTGAYMVKNWKAFNAAVVQRLVE
jgi:RHS repeat-associated protein